MGISLAVKPYHEVNGGHGSHGARLRDAFGRAGVSVALYDRYSEHWLQSLDVLACYGVHG